MARVLALHEQGYTQEVIAKELDVSQAAVSKILQRADARAAATLEPQLAARRMRQIRMLEHLSREGRSAFERSKQGRIRKRQRQATGESGAPVVTQEVVIDEQPDPRWLDEARKSEEALNELLGLTGRSSRGSAVAAAPPSLPDLTPDEIAARLNALLEIIPADPDPVTNGVPEPPTDSEPQEGDHD
jgi:predicted transcriptional regulator